MSKVTLFNVVRNVFFLICIFFGTICFADTSQKDNNLKSVTVIYNNGQKIVVSNPHFKRISNPGFIPKRYGTISTVKFKKDIKKNVTTTEWREISISEIEKIKVHKGVHNSYAILYLRDGKKVSLTNTRPLDLDSEMSKSLELVDYWQDTQPILMGDVKDNNSVGKFEASLEFDIYGPEGIVEFIFNYDE